MFSAYQRLRKTQTERSRTGCANFNATGTVLFFGLQFIHEDSQERFHIGH